MTTSIDFESEHILIVNRTYTEFGSWHLLTVNIILPVIRTYSDFGLVHIWLCMRPSIAIGSEHILTLDEDFYRLWITSSTNCDHILPVSRTYIDYESEHILILMSTYVDFASGHLRNLDQKIYGLWIRTWALQTPSLGSWHSVQYMIDPNMGLILLTLQLKFRSCIL